MIQTFGNYTLLSHLLRRIGGQESQEIPNSSTWPPIHTRCDREGSSYPHGGSSEILLVPSGLSFWTYLVVTGFLMAYPGILEIPGVVTDVHLQVDT